MNIPNNVDVGLALYGGLSILALVLVYSAKFIPRLNWSDPRMRETMGGDIHQVDPNSTMQDAVATTATNVAKSVNPGCVFAGLSLFVLFWGFMFGGFVVPAFFGWMHTITTLNILLLIVAGVCWGLTATRLALTGVFLFLGLLKLLFGAVLIGLVVALFGYAYVFLSGDRSPIDYMKNTLREYRRPNLQSFDFAKRLQVDFDKRLDFNQCAVYHGLKTVGDIEAVKAVCNPVLAPNNVYRRYRWH